MGMYHCRKGWGKGVATWGNHLLAIFLGLNFTVLVLLIKFLRSCKLFKLTFLSSLLKNFTKTLDLCGLVTWGASCFLEKFYLLLKDDPDLYLIVCALDCLMKNS